MDLISSSRASPVTINVALLGADDFNDGFVKCFRDAAAGESDVEGSAFGDRIDEVTSSGFGEELGGWIYF